MSFVHARLVSSFDESKSNTPFRRLLFSIVHLIVVAVVSVVAVVVAVVVGLIIIFLVCVRNLLTPDMIYLKIV